MKSHKPETEQMMRVVKRLESTPLPSLSDKAMQRIAAISGTKSRAPLFTFVSFSGAFAALAVIVVAAQFTLPGSPLYGIKRGTEYVRTLLQPSYESSLVDVRKQELTKLEAQQAPAALIEGAQLEYQKATERTAPQTPPSPPAQNTKNSAEQRDKPTRERPTTQSQPEARGQVRGKADVRGEAHGRP